MTWDSGDVLEMIHVASNAHIKWSHKFWKVVGDLRHVVVAQLLDEGPRSVPWLLSHNDNDVVLKKRNPGYT